MDSTEAHPVSPHNPDRDAAYQAISKALRQAYPTASVVPSKWLKSLKYFLK